MDYLSNVQANMGVKETDEFLRLYLAPGMGHCAGGPGPDAFGQTLAQPGDAEHNVTKALERWVESGTAPGPIIATKYSNASTPMIVRTRPLCPYPQVSVYKGSGSLDDAANVACQQPK